MIFKQSQVSYKKNHRTATDLDGVVYTDSLLHLPSNVVFGAQSTIKDNNLKQ